MRSRVTPFNSFVYNLNRIRFTFGEHYYDMLKSWIDLNYRMIRMWSRRYFLLQCKYNNIFPSHLMHINENRFHIIHYKSKLRLAKALHTFRRVILNTEIFDLNRIIDSLTNKLSHVSKILSDSLPTFIWNSITNHHLSSFNNLHIKLFSSYKKKFLWLQHLTKLNKTKEIKPIEFSCLVNGVNNKVLKASQKNPITSNNEILVQTKIDPTQFLDYPSDPLNTINNKWFINLSDSSIPAEISKLLQLGDKFSLPVSFNKKIAIHETIKDVESNIKSFQLENQVRIRNTIIPQFHKFLHLKTTVNTTTELLTSLTNSTKNFCQKNPEIIFTRADKGNITVALNKNDYFKKMEVLLGDTNTYTLIKKDPSTSIEKKLNDLIKNWYKKEYITKSEMLQLRSSDSLLPKAYGLPKIHKANAPLRIIVSSMNTALYPFAKFLNKILSDNIPPTKYHVRNGFELCSALSSKFIPVDCKLVSFDVTSLFTNVPIELAINSIEKRWELIERHTKIIKNEFIAAIKMLLSSTYFIFNKKIYKQTFGTPMGSPLSPIISDLVMRDLEDNVLNALNIQPILYYRYVDDIILSTYEEEIHNVLKEFNNYHPRLQFTIETEVNHTLNFLDVTLLIKNNRIVTDWFHKTTFSGRYLSFFSNHPINHKIGTIYGLVDHAIKLSHPSFYEKNLILCIKILLDNGYPLDLIFFKAEKIVRTKNNDCERLSSHRF